MIISLMLASSGEGMLSTIGVRGLTRSSYALWGSVALGATLAWTYVAARVFEESERRYAASWPQERRLAFVGMQLVILVTICAIWSATFD